MRLAVSGGVLTAADADYAIVLKFSNGWEIRIESPFALRPPAGEAVADLDPESPKSILPLQVLIGQAVTEAESSETVGRLVLCFDDRTVLTIEPDQEYEAWTSTGPSGEKLVCLPGGGLAIW